MVDGIHEVTTFCPRCTSPIVWTTREIDDETEPPEVSDWACDCALSDAEWSTIGDEARAMLGTPAAWAA